MNILAIGDIVGKNGCEFLKSKLPLYKKLKSIDVVIANGENSAEGNGITPNSARQIFSCGVDVITTGNHAFRRREVYQLLESEPYIIRPANYPENTTPGHGVCILDLGYVQVCVINLIGTVYMDNMDCPFKTIDKLLAQNQAAIKIVDFHAEATAEKRALGFYLDGKISSMFGTHTHVQTSDETILPKGTGYITDVGMTGAINSVLGLKPEISIKKIKEKLPIRYELETGPSQMDAVIFSIDHKTGKTTAVQRVRIK